MNSGFPIRQILTVLVAIPALYVCYFVFGTGHVGIALAILAVIVLGIFVYLALRQKPYDIYTPDCLVSDSS